MKLTIDVFRDGYYFRDEDWKESKHPRGQPGNAGQFTSGSGSPGGAVNPTKKAGLSKNTPSEQAKLDYDEMQELLESIGYKKKNANNFRHPGENHHIRVKYAPNGSIGFSPIYKVGGQWKLGPTLKSTSALGSLLEKWHGKPAPASKAARVSNQYQPLDVGTFKYMGGEMGDILAGIFEQYNELAPEIQKKIQGKISELEEIHNGTLENWDAKLSAIKPIPTNGPGPLAETNKLIEAYKEQYGVGKGNGTKEPLVEAPPSEKVSPEEDDDDEDMSEELKLLDEVHPEEKVAPTPKKTYEPKTAHEKGVYASIKGEAHFESEQTNVGIDADGHKIKAINMTNTNKILGDGHASVSSALADGDEVSEQVDSAMHEYSKKCTDKIHKVFGSDVLLDVMSYKGNGYMDINGELRMHEGVPQDKVAENIQKAIAASAVPADMLLWRGMHADLKQLTGFNDPALAVGRCFIHKSFTSSSRSKSSAENFGTTTMLKFHVKAGTPGLVIGDQESTSEREIVFNTRSMFRVLKVEQEMKHGHPKHILHVEYLGVAPPDESVATIKMAA